MTKKHSARVSMTSEEDPKIRATKKVKCREKEDQAETVTMGEASPASFREALLKVPGMDGMNEDFPSEEEWEDWVDDENLPENRWYREEEEVPAMKVKDNNGDSILEVKVSDEELKEWSKIGVSP